MLESYLELSYKVYNIYGVESQLQKYKGLVRLLAEY